MATDIIIHDKKDNVGVVVIEKITPKQDCSCWIMEDDSTVNIQSLDEIPLGHKIAMTDLNEGDTILKSIIAILCPRGISFNDFILTFPLFSIIQQEQS